MCILLGYFKVYRYICGVIKKQDYYMLICLYGKIYTNRSRRYEMVGGRQ